MSDWLGLAIGNSRLHWAWFVDNDLNSAWDTPHLLAEIDRERGSWSGSISKQDLPMSRFPRRASQRDRGVDSAKALNKIIPQRNREITNTNSIPIYLASVVPSQTALWQNYPQLHQITLAEIPLLNTYATLGIDRALAAYGAGETYHYPCLIIDGGTALTFTGVNRDRSLIGGAILPGLQAQFRSLQQQTAALPLVIPSNLPPRWALDTENAIASGIIYTTIAGIHNYINDWLDKFPDSSLVLTGGDNKLIFQYLQNIYPKITPQILVDDYLIFWGLRSLRARLNY